MFYDDYLHPLDTKTRDIVSGREEGEEFNYDLVVFRDKLEVEVMDDKEEFKKFIVIF